LLSTACAQSRSTAEAGSRRDGRRLTVDGERTHHRRLVAFAQECAAMFVIDRSRRSAAAVGAVLSMLTLATAARAQTPAPLDHAVAELRQLLAEQGALLKEQARIIEAQGRDLESLRKRVEGSSELPRAAAPVAHVESSLPTELVEAGDFPRSIRIPGTESAVRIGGQARLMMVHSLGPLGTDDRFVTSSIPVEGQQQSGENARVNYSAAASRVNLDLRSKTPRGDIRSFLETDFAGPNRTLRLRHAYAQTTHWLGGQTWSTFSDPEAEPMGIDFEGLNAISLFRQPQLRYTRAIKPTFDLALALENPAPDLTDASGVNVTPDIIARVRWNPKKRSTLLSRAAHIQAALLVRTLRGEVADHPELTLSTGGFGMNVSGVLIPRWDRDDRIKFATNNGWGIGRYIADLGTLGGQDGVYDPETESLRALPVSSAYGGYERMWRRSFTTAVTYGVVNVSNLDIQSPNSLRRTQRTTINLTWDPIPDASLVVEFLAGTRVNKDGKSGRSSQFQAGWLFRF
jgi:hypothetical protein